MIIALLNQKGGVGKTTIATHLAGELASVGEAVMIVDADPQGSALDWSQRRRQAGRPRRFGVIGLPRETLHHEVPEIARSVDHVIIDGPPRVTALTRAAIMAADLVLIPVQPSPYDLWASRDMLQLIAEARVFRPQMRSAFVISRRVVGTIIGQEGRMALSGLFVQPLTAEIHQRVVFAASATEGSLAGEVLPHCRAAQEISALTAEVIRFAHGG